MADWADSFPGNEPTPEERVLLNEEDEDSPVRLTEEEERVVRKTWNDMRRLRPDLYAVFRQWVDLFQLRDEDTRYTHGVYRGFYSEMARRLHLTEPAVSHRRKRGKLWFAHRLRKNDAAGGSR